MGIKRKAIRVDTFGGGPGALEAWTLEELNQLLAAKTTDGPARPDYVAVVNDAPLAPVDGPLVDEIKGWSSLWGDLLLVENALAYRSKLPDTAPNLFARRALWEAAVIDYWRGANKGRRQQQQVTGLVTELGPQAEQCHREIEVWRNRHVAHRVDEAREQVDVRLALDPNSGQPKKAAIQVAPVLGPEQEGSDLAERAVAHVRALKDLVWQERIRPLEEKLLDEHGDDGDLLEAAGKAPPTDPHFAITINP